MSRSSCCRGNESEVSPPKIECCQGAVSNDPLNNILGRWLSRTEWAKRFKLDENSKICLILIETDDKHEFNAIWEPFLTAMGKIGYIATALVFKHEGPRKVSSQAYGFKSGITNCCYQVINILSEKEEAIRTFDEEIKFHSIYVGAIGSYLDFDVKVDGKDKNVEFNVALYINPFAKHFGTQGGFWRISKGATLPKHFLLGTETVEEFRRYNAGTSDWHATSLKTGRSRHAILLECTTKIIRCHSKQLFESEYEGSSGKGFEIERGAIYVTGSKPNMASRLISNSVESRIFKADIRLKGRSNHERSEPSKLICKPEPEASRPVTFKTATTSSSASKAAVPSPRKPTPDGSKAVTSNSAMPGPKKPTPNRSSSATSNSTTSKAAAPDPKKLTSDGSKSVTHKVATSKAVTSNSATPDPKKPTPDKSNSTTSHSATSNSSTSKQKKSASLKPKLSELLPKRITEHRSRRGYEKLTE